MTISPSSKDFLSDLDFEEFKIAPLTDNVSTYHQFNLKINSFSNIPQILRYRSENVLLVYHQRATRCGLQTIIESIYAFLSVFSKPHTNDEVQVIYPENES